MAISTADRNIGRSAPTTRPAARPPIALRAFIGLLAIGTAMFNIALMLSDRAPGALKQIFGDFAIRLSNRLDAPRRFGDVTDRPRPQSDAIVHVGVWAVATLLIGLAVWRWSGLLLAVVFIFVGGIFIEIGQGRYTDTRAVEMRDVYANGLGIVSGAVACAMCYLAWSAVAGVVKSLRHR